MLSDENYDCDKCANKGCWCCLECLNHGTWYVEIEEDKTNAE